MVFAHFHFTQPTGFSNSVKNCHNFDKLFYPSSEFQNLKILGNKESVKEHNSVSPYSFAESLELIGSKSNSELEGGHNRALLPLTGRLDARQNVRGVLVVLLVAHNLTVSCLTVDCLVLLYCQVSRRSRGTCFASHVQRVVGWGHLLFLGL